MNTTPADPTNRSARPVPDTHQKALEVNLDPTSFGSFAEIGAGQEVARWFLNVGAASGTVAKTVSAYDKEVSDDLYGAGTRYVSRPRLEAILDGEWRALLHQVGAQRGATTRFFAFADTVAARNFAGTNDCHGWVGVRFQDRPRAEPSDVLIHVNLRDKANPLQQEAMGVLGVNLLHALLVVGPDRASASTSATDLPARLFDNLAEGRIEVDQVEMRGSAFAGCDVRVLHAALARDGLAEAVTLGADGTAVAANEFLYKKAVVIAPAAAAAGGPPDELSPAALAACTDELRRDVAGNSAVRDVIGVRLLNVRPGAALPDANRFAEGGAATLITRHEPLYKTTVFVRRYTQAPLHFALSLPAVMRVFDEVRYQTLDGRLLEGLARLFGHDVRVLAYPVRRDAVRHLLEGTAAAGRGWAIDEGGAAPESPWITADQIRPAPPLRHLYEYLLATGFLVANPPTGSGTSPRR